MEEDPNEYDGLQPLVIDELGLAPFSHTIEQRPDSEMFDDDAGDILRRERWM